MLTEISGVLSAIFLKEAEDLEAQEVALVLLLVQRQRLEDQELEQAL